MKSLSSIVALPVSFLLSCTTFVDLAERHPFPHNEPCPSGQVRDESGECRTFDEPDNVDHNATTGPQPNNEPRCDERPDDPCCEVPDGAECCDDADGCCDLSGGDSDLCTSPNSENPDNSVPNSLLSLFAVVIVDAGDVCQEEQGDGADISGVSLTIDGLWLRPTVLRFEPGSRGGTEDELLMMIESGESPDGDECPLDRAVALGCGGVLAVGFESDDPVALNSGGILRVHETGPQCDSANDRYHLFVCERESYLSTGSTADCLDSALDLEGTREFEF